MSDSKASDRIAWAFVIFVLLVAVVGVGVGFWAFISIVNWLVHK